MIRKGEKLEEYRDFKPYYITRFANAAGINPDYFKKHIEAGDDKELAGVTYDILFRNGYSGSSPSFMARVALDYRTGKKKWGAKPNRKYLVLEINEVWEAESGNQNESDDKETESVRKTPENVVSEPKTEQNSQKVSQNDQKAEQEQEMDLSELPFYDPGYEDEEPLVSEADYSEANEAKEWLDDFLTIPRMRSGGDVDYSAMEKYDEYHFEKAKEYVQTLYDIITGR